MPALKHDVTQYVMHNNYGALQPHELTSMGRLDKGRHVWGKEWRRVVGINRGPVKVV